MNNPYDLASMPIFLHGKIIDGLNFESWQLANNYAKALQNPNLDNFFVGDVISFPDNDMIIMMLPNFTDKILAFMMLLDISPDDLQNWLDGMLAELPEEEYNYGNSEDTSDNEVSHDETIVTTPSTEEFNLAITEERTDNPDYPNDNPLDDTGDKA